MAKKKQGHYCKVCGCYLANEKFSGKGHAAHICKSCAQLSVAERAQRIKENREPLFHYDADRDARNQLKKQLIINHLTFEIMTDVYDSYGDCVPVNCVFEIDRVSGWLYLHHAGETQQKRMKNASKALRWLVHTLEVFDWCEWDGSIVVEADDIPAHQIKNESSDGSILIEDDDDADEDDSDDFLFELFDDLSDDLTDDCKAELHPSKDNRAWSMAITYSHHWKQEFWSYSEMPEPAFEFYEHLMAYFEPEDDEESDDQSWCDNDA
ncbi:MAG: hypothetical protein RR975_09045 [Clostridia bacterium]